MDVDVIIFSRNRIVELQRTLESLAQYPFRVLVFHNSAKQLVLGAEHRNIEYFHCPGMSLSQRAMLAMEKLENRFSVICADDDGLIHSGIHEMVQFLETNSYFATVGGEVLGAFPYGNFITGNFAYAEMRSYENKEEDQRSRIKSHMLGISIKGLPRAAMYRLYRREGMISLLESLGLCSEIQTPYIFEVVSEFMSAWLGPTKYLNQIYWIRNWKTSMVSHSSWNRKFEFCDWWESETCELEREILLNSLSKLTQLELEFIKTVFQKYSNNRSKLTKRIVGEGKSSVDWPRKIKQFIMQKLFSSKIPPTLQSVIREQFPEMSDNEVNSIYKVAKGMLKGA